QMSILSLHDALPILSVTSTYMEMMISDFGVLACGQKAADGTSHRCKVFIEMPFKTLDRPAEGDRESTGERRPRQQHRNHPDAFRSEEHTSELQSLRH